MRSVRSIPSVVAACLVVSLTLAGCSDSDDDAASTTTTSTVATSTTRTVDTRFSGEGSGEFCQFLTAFTESQQNVTPSATPASLESAFSGSLAAIEQAATVAPSEIKPDVVAIDTALRTLQAAAADVDYDVSRLSASSLGALQDEGFLDSVTRLQVYLTNFCRTTTTTG